MKEKKILIKALKIAWILYALLSLIIWLPQIDGLFTHEKETTSKHVALDSHWDIATIVKITMMFRWIVSDLMLWI